MALDLSEERQHAHAFLDRLPDDQVSAVRGLLETIAVAARPQTGAGAHRR